MSERQREESREETQREETQRARDQAELQQRERSLEQRCDELERRSTHQERLIETLSEQIHEAFLQIQALQQQLKRFEARQQNESLPFGPAGEQPPHY